MAGSQKVSSRVRPSGRSFTVAEANKTIPYVSRIVADVVKVQAEQNASGFGGTLRQRMTDLLTELAGVGASMRDPDVGLIEYPGRHMGHDVRLSWKLGDDEVLWWYEASAGYGSRQPISTIQQ
jgi:hypothetical protein